MTARHMRDAAMSDVFDGMEKPITTVHEDDDRIRYAPVAIAFTEAEVLALAELVAMASLDLGGVLSPEERSAIDAIYDAALDIESKEKEA